jgi:drug/metabolite transporter (DMT)-like permease
MSVIWGANFSVMKYGTTVIPPLGYNAVRIALAAVMLLVIAMLLAGPAPSRRDALAIFALGAFGNGVYQIIWVEGLSMTRAGEAALVVGASPALMALVGRLRGVELVTARGVAGIVLSILGVTLIVLGRATSGAAAPGGSLAGDLLVLGAAVCWAIYTVWLLPYTRRVSGWWVTALSIAGGAVVLLFVGTPDILRIAWRSVPQNLWAAILYGSIGSMVVAYFFWYYGVRKLGPTRTALFGNLQPFVALLVAWMALGEVPTLWQGIGAVTIVSGVLLTRARSAEVS